MLLIGSQHQNEIASHGERDYPYECCGLLIGQFGKDGTKITLETYGISNAREEQAKRNRFLITPDELLRGQRYAERKELEIVGFYHSHPDHPAVPSEYDRDHAWPVFSYIVVAVHDGKAKDMHSWTLRADRSAFEQEEILEGKLPC